jgi:predicted MFS family arabinose efflux permease
MSGAILSTRQRRYALGVLTLVYMLNLTDRGLVILLLESIKTDLRLSDTQLGALTGVAFGLLYAVFGLPFARWSDRGDRVGLASIAIAIWGVTVMATLLVASFIQLFVARMAAAVGEAGCKPPTYSLVGDLYPQPADRIRAMSIYWLGSPLSVILSFMIGGWLGQHYGWRAAFFVMGVPGLILALVVRLTLADPRVRRGSNVPARPAHSTMAVASLIWNRPACRHVCIGLVLVFSINFGLSPWYGAFLIRSHGMQTDELGLWLGLIFSISGVVALLAGGLVGSRLLAENDKGQLTMTALTVALLVPFYLLFLLVPGKAQALLAMVPLMLVFNFYVAPIYALLQRLVPDEMRAMVLALVMLFANVIGMGLCPPLVGILSDTIRPHFGTDSLRYAMLSVAALSLWASYHFWCARRCVAADIAIADRERVDAARIGASAAAVLRG